MNLVAIRLALSAGLLFRVLTPLAGAGVEDSEFKRTNFSEWLSDRQTPMKWSVEIAPAALSSHQRMRLRAQIRIAAGESGNRSAPGQLMVLIQYQSPGGDVWQTHSVLAGNVSANQDAFLLPGDYQIIFALWDTARNEHNLIRRRVHVAPLDPEPLPAAWTGLPAVELIPPASVNDPDAWFLPRVEGRLNLPIRTRRPVHVEVLLNSTPSTASAASLTAFRSSMSLLVPALKVMTWLRCGPDPPDVTVLDLSRGRAVFHQTDMQRLDWQVMRPFFADSNPGMVNADVLATEARLNEYFTDEVNRRMKISDGLAHVVVVLSGPAFMPERKPPELPMQRPDANHLLIYIRYRDDPIYYARRIRYGTPRLPPPILANPPMPLDDLQHLIEPMQARIYDAKSPAEFRRVLAAVMQQIAAF